MCCSTLAAGLHLTWPRRVAPPGDNAGVPSDGQCHAVTHRTNIVSFSPSCLALGTEACQNKPRADLHSIATGLPLAMGPPPPRHPLHLHVVKVNYFGLVSLYTESVSQEVLDDLLFSSVRRSWFRIRSGG